MRLAAISPSHAATLLVRLQPAFLTPSMVCAGVCAGEFRSAVYSWFTEGFGIVTVIGAEIGLLTPPLGISCFTIKSTIRDPTITLTHIFSGAFPFACIMLLVPVAIVAVPWLSLALI